jgi:hypothetical protein
MRLGRLWRGCATGDPQDGFEHCVRNLTVLIEGAIAELGGEFGHTR